MQVQSYECPPKPTWTSRDSMDNSELPAIRGSSSRESLAADDREASAAASADGDKVATS